MLYWYLKKIEEIMGRAENRVTWVLEVIALKPVNHVFSCEEEQQN